MSELREMIIASITDLTGQANEVAARIGAATTDRTKIVHDMLTDESTTDEKVKAFQTWKEQILAKLEEEEAKARDYVASKLPEADESNVETDKASYKELADKVKTARKFYLSGGVPDAKEEDLADVPALKTLRGGTAGGGSGSKRPRLQRIAYRTSTEDNWTEVSKQAKNAKGEEVTVANFTVLAQALKPLGKVEVKDLQAAAFETAGTDDLSTLDGKVFEFAITAGETNVFVQVQPKSDSDE